jgi:phosphoribosylformylglycinamidine cyclo-ligase
LSEEKINKDHNISKKITYSSSGVNIDKANDLIDEIKPIVRKTQRPGADTKIGGFGGIFDLSFCNYKDPLLVSSTDGVGTKLLLAIDHNFYDNIGIDLVAMCVNDLIVQGAEPLYFLDYFATGVLSNQVATKIIKSISEGCIQSNCALIGGETAEMPGLYEKKHFDLAGFSVGIVERDSLLPSNKITEGDIIIGFPSNGLHSNGYSLVRNIINQKNIKTSLPMPNNSKKTISEVLLDPTKIYVKLILDLLNNTSGVKAISHITGGGITENLPRVFPNTSVTAQINLSSWDRPEIFTWLKNLGNIDEDEILKTLNCGIGLTLVVDPNELENTSNYLNKINEDYFIIGEIINNKKDQSEIIYNKG